MPLKMTPPDEGEGEALMLLFTVHGPGGYADNNDFTYGESETRFDAGPLRITTPLDQNMKVPEDIEITHIIIYVRACIFSPGVNDFTQSAIVYGNSRALTLPWPVGSDFITLDSGTILTAPSGGRWTAPEILSLVVGAEAIWNGLSFVSGTINMSEVYIEVYGRESASIRNRRFSPGVYRLRIGPRARVARLTSDEARSIYEAARLPKDDGTHVPLGFTVVELDNRQIRPSVYKIDSTAADMIAALAAAREPDIGG